MPSIKPLNRADIANGDFEPGARFIQLPDRAPDFITNQDRADWARAALQAFATAHYGNENDLDNPETVDMILGDFLGDLYHWVGCEEVDASLERGHEAYHEEVAEEEYGLRTVTLELPPFEPQPLNGAH